ncbi:MAG: hypothetical protein V1492_03415 [Candidatus Micrarchaeota archaeon]
MPRVPGIHPIRTLKMLVREQLIKRELKKKHGDELRRDYGDKRLQLEPLLLRNKDGEEVKIYGLVPQDIQKIEAIKLILEQNGGSYCEEKGIGELSEFTLIKSITLKDGFTVADYLQIRNRNGEFKASIVNGIAYWENGNTDRVRKGDRGILITEDFGETRELPTPQNILAGKEKAGGGCGGALGEGELDVAKLAARFNIQRQEYYINLDNGRIRKADGFMKLQKEFVYTPDKLPIQILVPRELLQFDAGEMTKLNIYNTLQLLRRGTMQKYQDDALPAFGVQIPTMQKEQMNTFNASKLYFTDHGKTDEKPAEEAAETKEAKQVEETEQEETKEKEAAQEKPKDEKELIRSLLRKIKDDDGEKKDDANEEKKDEKPAAKQKKKKKPAEEPAEEKKLIEKIKEKIEAKPKETNAAVVIKLARSPKKPAKKPETKKPALPQKKVKPKPVAKPAKKKPAKVKIKAIVKKPKETVKPAKKLQPKQIKQLAQKPKKAVKPKKVVKLKVTPKVKPVDKAKLKKELAAIAKAKQKEIAEEKLAAKKAAKKAAKIAKAKEKLAAKLAKIAEAKKKADAKLEKLKAKPNIPKDAPWWKKQFLRDYHGLSKRKKR